MKTIFVLAAACCLLAGCADEMTVKVGNALDVDRTGEIVEVPVGALAKKGIADPSKAVVVNKATGEEIPSQLTYDGKLIFPVSVPAEGGAEYVISEGQPARYEAKTYGRYVPERKDDVAWENDRIAFRAYGPALEAGGELSSGYDVWVKSTGEMVLDHRYALEFTPEQLAVKDKLKAAGDTDGYNEFKKKYSIHIDHGNGLDYYAVGRTLGCGAMAPYTEGKLWLSNNYVTYEILDNGPLRFTCKLTYAPFGADGRMLKEERLISLDAGTHFCHAVVTYTDTDGRQFTPVQAAAGIILHGTEDYAMNPEAGYIHYADPVSETDGQTYLGVIFPEGSWTTKVDCNHVLAISQQTAAGEGLSYRFGAGWSKYGFPTPADWAAHVEQNARLLRSPLNVEIF